MRSLARITLEGLERRLLFAVKTVDFGNYPINTGQIDWLLKDSHTPSTGFSYTLGSGDGQRQNINGITWPDANYYDTVLGAGGFAAVNSWNMKPLVLYANQKNGDWLTQGWNYTQDMAEGAACVDDAARMAVTLATDYLLNGTAASYQKAKDVLTFVAYMTTRQGKTYNFAWLDSPAIFGWDPIQAQDKNYEYRVEYVKRTQYPSATPNSSWFDSNSDPAHIIAPTTAAPPFHAHAKYSIYMDDLRDASNNDVALVYDGPLYTTAGGGATSFKTGIKKTWTNSTQAFGLDEARAIWAFAEGLNMMQKFASLNGGLAGDDLIFAKFLENHMNRLLQNLRLQSVSGFDSKMASVLLVALCDYDQLLYGTTENGTYTPRLVANSNTFETTDDRVSQSDINTMIDQLSSRIKATQYRTTDWRNGIFIDDLAGGNWDAWGQMQIYALARDYRLKINLGANPADPAVASLLDYAAYAADNFYGIEAYHYAAPGTNNVRTKERINLISNWSAQYQTNSNQIAYYQSSIVAGLRELARAYEVSDRPDKATRMATYLNDMKSVASWFIGNNTSLLDMYDGSSPVAGTFRGRGEVFDGIGVSGGIPVINRNSGGESQDEGVWAMILAKDAIAHYGLDPTFTFETGTSGVAAPVVTSSSFDFDASQPTLRFAFSQNVGASINPFDLNIVNTTSGQTIATASIALGYNAALREMDVTFPGYSGGVLPDGNYVATVQANGIAGNSGNPMAADYSLNFFVLAGDANRDRSVDTVDFNTLAANFGQTGQLFSQGDFNYDGTVDTIDFNILASRFSQSLPVAPAPLAVGTAPISSPFNSAGSFASAWTRLTEGDSQNSDAMGRIGGAGRWAYGRGMLSV
jgi:hypothetical protein